MIPLLGFVANLIPTLGFGGGAAPVVVQTGRFLRRGKLKLWPQEEYKAPERDEWLALQTQIEALQADRAVLIADLNRTQKASELGVKRIELVRQLRGQRNEIDAELARLRMRRKKVRDQLVQIIQDEEDELVLFLANELLN